jgi:hypothetical protein
LRTVDDVELPIFITLAVDDPVPILMADKDVRAPVPIFKLPDVCADANDTSTVCAPPIVKVPVVRFEPMVIAVPEVVESTTGDVNFVTTSTEVPFNDVVVCDVVPIVIAHAPDATVPILIAAPLRFAPAPRFKTPDVCPEPILISPVCVVPPMAIDPSVRFAPIVIAVLVAFALIIGADICVSTPTL